MKKQLMNISLYSALSILILSYSTDVQAKKRCKPFLAKLHQIQAMQRQSYSLKRGQSLRAKEDKARDKWWQCEHTSLAKFKAENGGGKKKPKKKVNKKRPAKYTKAKRNNTATKKNSLNYSVKAIPIFNQSSAIVIKAKYQGEKRLAWSTYYQRPSKCISPKSFNVFAFCSENKLQQQNQFEQEYDKN